MSDSILLREAAAAMRSREDSTWASVADFLEYAADYSENLRGLRPPTVERAMSIALAHLRPVTPPELRGNV